MYKDKAGRKLTSKKDKEESGVEVLSGSLDELLVVKKANILCKSKSDASASSTRWGKAKHAKSFDKSSTCSLSAESFSSALSINPSQEELFKECDIETAEICPRDSVDRTIDECSEKWRTCSSNLRDTDTKETLQTSNIYAHYQIPTSCDMPATEVKLSASLPPSESSEISDLKDINLGKAIDSESARIVANGIIQEALTETCNVDEFKEETDDCQDLAEVIASVAAAQACLENLEEDCAQRVEELERQRDEESAKNEALLLRVSELQDLKETLSDLVSTIDSRYAETINSMNETHASQLEISKLEAGKAINELVGEVTELSGKLLVAESLLAGKDEVEAALNNRIATLENTLREKEEHCIEELQCMVSKNIKNEVLIEAKKEVENEVLSEYENKACDEEIDRAWLVSDLRRAESELSFQIEDAGEGDCGDPWMKSSLHCAYLTVHSPSLKDIEISGADSVNTLPLKRKKRSLKKYDYSPRQVLAHSDKQDIAIHANHNDLKQLKEMMYQLKCFENEKVALATKNNSLEEDLAFHRHRLNSVLAENELLHRNVLTTNEELKAALDKLEVLEQASSQKAILQNKISELEESLDHKSNENVNLDQNCRTLENALSQAISDRDKILAKNDELSVSLCSAMEDLKLKEALEAQVVDYKELFEKLQQGFNQSRLSLGSSRRGDSTIYMEYFPAAPVDACTQTDENVVALNAKSRSQPERESIDERCAVLEQELNLFGATVEKFKSEKINRHRLEKELETSWTERCEVEEQLACALAENSVLTQRVNTIEQASRRLTLLMSPGIASPTAWQQLQNNEKEILANLAVLNGTWKEEGEEDGEPRKDAEGEGESLQFLVSGIREPRSIESTCQVLAGERMEPEGGALPPTAENLADTNDLQAADELTQTDEALLEQNSSTLVDIVQELLRYMGACENELNVSLGERLRITPDISTVLESSNAPEVRDELDRCVAQLKEEVAHIFAISRRSDLPGTVQRLQEEINSLEQQVSASDKQVKSMRAFLDEQAAERELERDESSRQLEELNELLRQKERQIMGCEQLKSDVDNIEQQLQVALIALKKCDEERTDYSTKLEEAMNKIWTMRDIIEELEKSVAARSEELETTKQHNDRLQNQLLQLGQISLEMETASKDSHTDLLAYVAKLEEEVTSLRHRVELNSPESLIAVRTSLRDIEVAIARRTKDLEFVTIASAALSSASEDVSTKELADITRCQTPDEMKGEIPVGLEEDVDRLKERLLKHSRAEEAVLRKITELESQARKVEELQVDLEVAMHRLESYLSENALLKEKIEEQRPKYFQKQLVADLDQKIRQMEKELENAQNDLRSKEQLLADSRKREDRLAEAMAAQEAIYRNEYSLQNAIKDELQSEKQRAEAANARLQELSNLPTVVNVLLAKKNEELDILKMQFSEATSREFAMQSSMNSGPTSSKCSSSIGGKRVKFSVPESFVESITPIPMEPLSVMRNVSESQNEWFASESPSKRCLPWDNISSVAALQLSPRGTSSAHARPPSPMETLISRVLPSPQKEILTESSLPNKPPDDNGQNYVMKLEQLDLELSESQKELESVKAALKEMTCTCNNYETVVSALDLENKEKQDIISNLKKKHLESITQLEKQSTELESLRREMWQAGQELKRLEENRTLEVNLVKSQLAKVSSDAGDNEEFKRLAREAVDDVREQLSSADSELKKRIAESEKLNEHVRELTEIMRNERELGRKKEIDADTQLSDIIKQLTKQREETKSLRETLLRTCDELEVARNERKELIANRDEKVSCVEKELIVKECELQQLNLVLDTKADEILALKEEISEKIILISKLSQEKDVLEKLVKQNESSVLAARSQLLQKDAEIEEIKKDSKQKIDILTSRLDKDKDLLDAEREKLSQVLIELEEYSAKAKDVNDEMVRLREQLHKQEEEKKVIEEHLKHQELIVHNHVSALEEKTRLVASMEEKLVEERRKVEVIEGRMLQQEQIAIRAGGDRASPKNVKFSSERVTNATNLEDSSENISFLKERIRQLEKHIETLEDKLRKDFARCDEDAHIMSQLRTSLEKCLDRTEILQSELVSSQRRSECLELELSRTRTAAQQLRSSLDNAQSCQTASLQREEELMNQLSAAQSQVRRLTNLVESQAVQVHALSALHSHDIHPPLITSSIVVPRAIRSAGDGAETPQEYRIRIQRLESYRKALVWQKRYLQLRSHGSVRAWGSRRRITFRTAGILVIAMLRMKFLVRRWRSRLPPLTPSPLSARGLLVPLMMVPATRTETYGSNHLLRHNTPENMNTLENLK